VTVTFNAWKDGRVKPATYLVPIIGAMQMK
jgi:hypothetical protein